MCIVRYLETSKYCPICDVQVHKTKPLLNIRWEPMWIFNLLLGQKPRCFPYTCSSDMIHLSSPQSNWTVLLSTAGLRYASMQTLSFPTDLHTNYACVKHSKQLFVLWDNPSAVVCCHPFCLFLNINVDGTGVIFQSPSRSDKTLQDIVYKLVPGLFKSKSMATNLFVNNCFSAQIKKRAAPIFSAAKWLLSIRLNVQFIDSPVVYY